MRGFTGDFLSGTGRASRKNLQDSSVVGAWKPVALLSRDFSKFSVKKFSRAPSPKYFMNCRQVTGGWAVWEFGWKGKIPHGGLKPGSTVNSRLPPLPGTDLPPSFTETEKQVGPILEVRHFLPA